MIRVNLLAHREERRKAQRRQLVFLAVISAALGGAIWLAVHGVIGGYVSLQNERNEFLKRENAKLDKEIEEIKKLRDEIASRRSRSSATRSRRCSPARRSSRRCRPTAPGRSSSSTSSSGRPRTASTSSR